MTNAIVLTVLAALFALWLREVLRDPPSSRTHFKSDMWL